jgi:hypothetical protein
MPLHQNLTKTRLEDQLSGPSSSTRQAATTKSGTIAGKEWLIQKLQEETLEKVSAYSQSFDFNSYRIENEQ